MSFRSKTAINLHHYVAFYIFFIFGVTCVFVITKSFSAMWLRTSLGPQSGFSQIVFVFFINHQYLIAFPLLSLIILHGWPSSLHFFSFSFRFYTFLPTRWLSSFLYFLKLANVFIQLVHLKWVCWLQEWGGGFFHSLLGIYTTDLNSTFVFDNTA